MRYLLRTRLPGIKINGLPHAHHVLFLSFSVGTGNESPLSVLIS